MAETLGGLIDKYTIAKIRLMNLMVVKKNVNIKSKIKIVENQCESLSKEINDYLFLAIHKNIELEEPKVKFYKNEKDNDINEFKSIGVAVSNLFDANKTLWDLEDKRRTLTIPDAERLKACDDVSYWNKKRNHCIDTINFMFSEMVKYSKSPKKTKKFAKHK